ncbi:TIGR04283 family arsenosugar biosynthesis glycosyltransferase [Alcanivorax sp. DP30]|uniref:TIGR04283 family arsenosugar biosynthesis glycosyltransferase n=1 Tax=Alcanivorax sp. DP30 TaxID=2606217 RepID=UPI00136F71DF|nr:glycosyltransferase [Alcanivorax sp. DP30]
MNSVSVIVPVLNEAAQLAEVLASIRRALQEEDELIVVDGGSLDGSAEIAERFADRVVHSPPGRARQMNAGAAQSSGEWLWFVHADSQLLPAHRAALVSLPEKASWGRFDVRLSGQRMMYAVIATLMNLRSRFTAIATGDQAIFVRRDVFSVVGGFADQPLMEDIALSARLRQRSRPCCVGPAVVTSSRRWQKNGVWRTIWLMWTLRWRYWRGEDPARLHREYYG